MIINGRIMKKKVIKKEITHQNIGGKEFIPEIELSLDDVIFKGTIDGNWACKNFLDRRPDIISSTYHHPKIFYGKVGHLGYVVAEDEFEEDDMK